MEYLHVELQEARELFDKYDKCFNKEFRTELRFLILQKTEPKSAAKVEDTSSHQPSALTQKIYRNLAKKMHPDVSVIINAEQEFKKLVASYENDDLMEIIFLSHKHNFDLPELTSQDIKIIEKKIIHIQTKIQTYEATLAWLWNTSTQDKTKLKKTIYKILNLNKEEFEKWKMEVAGIEPAS